MVFGDLVFVGEEIRVIGDKGYLFVCHLLSIEQMTSF